MLRDAYFRTGMITARAANPDAAAETSKYKDYWGFRRICG